MHGERLGRVFGAPLVRSGEDLLKVLERLSELLDLTQNEGGDAEGEGHVAPGARVGRRVQHERSQAGRNKLDYCNLTNFFLLPLSILVGKIVFDFPGSLKRPIDCSPGLEGAISVAVVGGTDLGAEYAH